MKTKELGPGGVRRKIFVCRSANALSSTSVPCLMLLIQSLWKSHFQTDFPTSQKFRGPDLGTVFRSDSMNRKKFSGFEDFAVLTLRTISKFDIWQYR